MITTHDPVTGAEYPVAAFVTDPSFMKVRQRAARELRDVRWFLDEPNEPIHRQSRNYINWLHHLGVNKIFSKWFAPIWTVETLRTLAREVFGYEESPIVELGTRTVSSYIRYLLFTRGWSEAAVTKHLVEDLGYPYNSSKPLTRRIMRDETAQRQKHKDENEGALFQDLVTH